MMLQKCSSFWTKPTNNEHKTPKKNEEVNGGNKMLLLGSSIPAIHVLQKHQSWNSISEPIIHILEKT